MLSTRLSSKLGTLTSLVALLSACGDGFDSTTGATTTTESDAHEGGGGSGAGTSGTGASIGTGGSTPCEPGAIEPCYDGPAGTDGKGTCTAGTRACLSDGTGFGPCMGQVLPAPTDDCATANQDEDCTGAANEDCPCAPGQTAACYTGPGGTEGVGICSGGTQTCLPDGSGFGPCEGEILPAAESCGPPEDEDCNGIACAQPLWAKVLGDSGPQSATAVAVDAAGNVYVAGGVDGAIDLGGGALVSAGGTDIFVAKFSETGQHIWSERFGAGGQQLVSGLAVDATGNVTITGHYDGAFSIGGSSLLVGAPFFADHPGFVARLDASGAPQWAHAFGLSGFVLPYAVAVDSAGSTVVAGSFDSCLTSKLVNFVAQCTLASAGLYDAFVAKLDASGNVLWAKAFGNSSDQTARAVAVDSSNSIYLAGGFRGSINFGGSTHVASAAQDNVFVAKLDANGAYGYSLAFGDDSAQRAYGVAVDSAGAAFVVGTMNGTMTAGGTTLTSAGGSDAFLVEVAANGNVGWAKRFGDAGIEQALRGVVVDGAGRILVAGDFDNAIDFGGGALTSVGGTDSALAVFDAAGNHLWSKRFGDAAGQLGLAVAAAEGAPILVGRVGGTVDFGTGPMVASGLDASIAKFAP